MRRNVGFGLLLAPALAALVVAALPGTTSAFTAPAPLSADADATRPVMLPLALREVTEPHPPLRTPSYFAQGPVVSIYGHPGVCFMGELGCHDAAGAVARARELAEQYNAPISEPPAGSFPRYALPALHLIVDVAQAAPQADDSYLLRTPIEEVRTYVEAARDAGVLLFLDLQVGWTDPLSGVTRLEEFLREPFVHVALDPEFATQRYGRAPGSVIGSLDTTQVRPVQAYLARLAAARGLPPKILVLHQFTPEMLIGMDALEHSPDVDVVVDMDGFGGQPEKLGGYNRYARASYAEYSGFKLFFHWDTPLFTPAQLMALDGPPHYIVYQ
ncbi:MAG: hypothetical protein EPO16_01030 [Dehalococcoidia bacterium]|nr:MAG: hypothetical protein EPO16_01030 [Dehalococcoidia bacterium]